MNWPPHRFHGKAEAPKDCVHCPLPEDNPLHVKPVDAEEAMLGPVYSFVAADAEFDPPTPPFMYFRCYPCPGCGSQFQLSHREGCSHARKPEDRMQIDPALVAALRRADATGNVAELHPDNVWKPRMIEEAPKDVSAFVPASAGYAYTEWDLVRRSRASLGVGGIVGFCIGFALAVLVCWQAWGNG